MNKIRKWQMAADFLQRNGSITAMDIIIHCHTDSPHKYIQILKAKVGLEELKTDKPYKIFIPANPQLKLNL